MEIKRLRLGFVPVPVIFRVTTSPRVLSELRSFSTPVKLRKTVRACLPSDKTSSSTSGESSCSKPNTLSKSEQMAVLLGQDIAELKRKAEHQKLELRNENIRNYGIALATTVVTCAVFAIQKADLSSGLNLMTVLRRSSAPIEVIGTNGKPTMIEFSAKWCENCKAMAPRVFELEKEFAGRVNFIVVDGEDPMRQEIVDDYGVDGIPQFSMVGKDGKVRGNLIGMVPKGALRSDLDALLREESLPFPGLSLEELRSPPV